MTVSKVHQYQPIVAGSRLRALPIILRDAITGEYLDMTGATVTITIIDETTNETVVADGAAEQNASNPYLIEYHLKPQEVAKITRQSTWLMEWTITDGAGRTHHHPTLCRATVRPRTT